MGPSGSPITDDPGGYCSSRFRSCASAFSATNPDGELVRYKWARVPQPREMRTFNRASKYPWRA